MVYIKINPGLAHPTSLTSFISHLFHWLAKLWLQWPCSHNTTSLFCTSYSLGYRLFQIIHRLNPPHLPYKYHLKYPPSETFLSWLPCSNYIPLPCSSPHHSLFDITLPYFVFSLYLSQKLFYSFILNVCLLH